MINQPYCIAELTKHDGIHEVFTRFIKILIPFTSLCLMFELTLHERKGQASSYIIFLIKHSIIFLS